MASHEYPPAANLLEEMADHPLPSIPPGIIDPSVMTPEETTKQAQAVVDALNHALDTEDMTAVANCFFPEQAYWRDFLAFTYHLRTFVGRDSAVASLVETKKLRGNVPGGFRLKNTHFAPMPPTLMVIDCRLSFKTLSPAATCSGRLLLLPVATVDGKVEWKIWILATRLEEFDSFPEDQEALTGPARDLNGVESFETDVFIIGGGNAAVVLAARLKTLGVDSVMAEKNPNIGDNWALRYDCLKFHVPTSICEMPYLPYHKQYHSPNLLTRDALAAQIINYVQTFNLNIITSATIKSTTFNQLTKLYTIKLQTLSGTITATAKHIVPATGFGFHKPYLPFIPKPSLYTGLSIHSTQFKNAKSLEEKGIKSVILVGSANTAFDILEDIYYNTSIPLTTMISRSPTIITPIEHVVSPLLWGAYDVIGNVDAADHVFMTTPTWPAGHIIQGIYGILAGQEPNRYKPLAEKGFPVWDMTHPEANLLNIIIVRGGGHYVDIGGTKVIVEGDERVKVKAGVEPVEWTESGLKFEDGTEENADAVIWCTGYMDKNGKDVVLEILGGPLEDEKEEGGVLGPEEIAERVESTWGVDKEGELRGMWKRQLKMDNFWYMGGHTQHHRFYSKLLALQIKAELEGILPPAYRGH